MEIDYELTPEDVLAFHLAHADAYPARGRGRRWFSLALALGSTALCVALDLQLGSISIISIGAFVLLAFSLLLLLVPRRVLLRRSVNRLLAQGNNTRRFLGPRHLTLAPEGLKAADGDSASFHDWAGIERLVVTDDYFFIFISTITGHVIPRRVFADEDDFQEFVRMARQYHERAAEPPEIAELASDTAIRVEQSRGHYRQ
jgi:hypothetical protein